MERPQSAVSAFGIAKESCGPAQAATSTSIYYPSSSSSLPLHPSIAPVTPPLLLLSARSMYSMLSILLLTRLAYGEQARTWTWVETPHELAALDSNNAEEIYENDLR